MDEENTPAVEVAPQADEAQIEQPATEEVATPPQTAEDTGEKLYAGKYKSPEDMEKAYLESQSKLTQLAQEKAKLEAERVQQEFVPPVVSEGFDEDTVNFVKSVYAQERERERVTEFVTKNQEKLADPVLRGAVKEIIAEARNSGQYIDQNEALRLAESQIAARLSPQVAEAKAAGEREGVEIANKKEQLAGIGTTASKKDIDPSTLSAKEFAEFYQLKRT